MIELCTPIFRGNLNAADMVGVDVHRYKTYAFALSAVFCGSVGAISASWSAYIAPTDAFSILTTLKVPVMVLLGGAGTVLGPVLGATSFTIIEQAVWSSFLDYNQAVLGIVVVLLIFFLPGGLMGRLGARRRPRPHGSTQAARPPAVEQAEPSTFPWPAAPR